jgi:DNA-binding beta-propeller fold protein YncE
MKTLWVAIGLLAVGSGGCGDDSTCDGTIPGAICTIVGTGENGYTGDDGPALKARLSLPQDTIVAPDGRLFVLDWNNHRVRAVDVDGTIRHVAGRGELGGTLDDPANDDFNHPTGMLFSPDGRQLLVAAWHNSKIRAIDLASGDIVDTCGDGRRAYFGDDGPAVTATLDLPASIAFDPSGNLVVMDQANQVLRYIDAAGNIHHLAGNCIVDRAQPEGPGPCAEGVEPTPCNAPSNKFTCGDASSCMQACNPGYTGDEIAAIDLRMAQPFGQSADPAGRILYDPAGNLYFADTANAIIRMIDTNGMVHRVAGVAPVDGRAQSGYSGDGGPAVDAMLNNPVDLALDDDGTLYFSDVYNHCVRAVGTDGTISTVAGVCGQPGTEGDGGPATEALLKRPYGVDVSGGVLYISDTGNNTIRAITLP